MNKKRAPPLLLMAILSIPVAKGILLLPPSPRGNISDKMSMCAMEDLSSKPSIRPEHVMENARTWEELATKHLMEWLPEQKTAASRGNFNFTGPHMCASIEFGNTRPRRSRNKLLWFTAITAVEREDPGRSVNYLNGVKVMVISARRNAPSLIPVVIYLGGKRTDCFVHWLENHGAYVLVVDRLSFMNLLPSHATDHSSASMANYGAFAVLDLPRFWARVWSNDFANTMTAAGADREYALFTDADVLFSADIPSTMNLAYEPQHFPPRLMLVLSERWWPHVVREGFNTAAYYVNVSAFGEILPTLLRFAVSKDWRFSEGLRDQGLLNDFFRAYSNSPKSHPFELTGHLAGLRPMEMHPYFGWRPYGGGSLKLRINESGRGQELKYLAMLLRDSIMRYKDDRPRIWHFHGAKIWETRCYLAEHAMRWGEKVHISTAGTESCQAIRRTTRKGFMVSSMSNPHIYVSPCALITYARLLDYFDALLSGDLAPNLSGLSNSDEGLEGPKFDAAGTLLMNRKDEDREMFLWAIDRLRRQIISLGAKPVVALPDE